MELYAAQHPHNYYFRAKQLPGPARCWRHRCAFCAERPLLILSSFPISNISPLTHSAGRKRGWGGEGSRVATGRPGPARPGPAWPGPAWRGVGAPRLMAAAASRVKGRGCRGVRGGQGGAPPNHHHHTGPATRRCRAAPPGRLRGSADPPPRGPWRRPPRPRPRARQFSRRRGCAAPQPPHGLGEAAAGHAATATAAVGPVLSDLLLILSSFPISNISPFTHKVRAGRGRGRGGIARPNAGPVRPDQARPGPAWPDPTRPGPAPLV